MVQAAALHKAYLPHIDIGDDQTLDRVDSRNTLIVVVLKDSDGYVQTVFRRNDLLDVELMDMTCGRDRLRAVSRSGMRRLKQKLDVEVMQPFPLFSGKWTTVIDVAIRELEYVDIPINDQTMVRLPTDRFLTVFEKAEVKQIAKRKPTDIRVANARRVEETILEFTALKIKRRLDETIELPPLSPSAKQLMDLRIDPNANLMDLVHIIEKDPSLTASILRWSKSSYYTHAGKVTDLRDAIGRVMGFELVMNLAMGLVLSGAIEMPEEHPEGFMEYWKQAIWVAQISASLTRCIPQDRRPKVGVCYLIGILHNFGYLILGHVFPTYFNLMCRHWEANRHHDTYIVEKSVLGITREDIAAQLFKCWDMPPEIVSAIQHQKDDTYDGEYSTYVDMIQASRSLLVERLGLDLGYEVPPSKRYLDRLGVDRERLEEQLVLLDESRSHVDSLAALL